MTHLQLSAQHSVFWKVVDFCIWKQYTA